MESNPLPLKDRSRDRIALDSIVRLALKRRLRPLILVGIMGLIITQIVALSPSSIEESRSKDENATLDPETLVEGPVTLAPGIPKDRVPEYTVDQFNFVSTQGSEKQWNLLANQAYLYNQDKLVHARTVKAFLYDPEGKITVVTGKEAKYFMNQRDLEIFGSVKTVMPDGFEIDSEYMRYRPNDKIIEIPTRYPVAGHGVDEKSGQLMEFTSEGLNYFMKKSEIILPQTVRVTVEKPDKPGDPKRLDSRTTIESDHCVIHRDQQIAHFTMNPGRPLSTRFVHITQPTLYSRGRRADLNYGDMDQLLNYVVHYEDVLVKETGEGPSLRYATGGRADFDTKRNVIIMTEYPQAYQDSDTVTGDVILMHRDTDVIEVEHSNAFSQGGDD